MVVSTAKKTPEKAPLKHDEKKTTTEKTAEPSKPTPSSIAKIINAILLYLTLVGIGAICGYMVFSSIYNHRCSDLLDDAERVFNSSRLELQDRYMQAVEETHRCQEEESKLTKLDQDKYQSLLDQQKQSDKEVSSLQQQVKESESQTRELQEVLSQKDSEIKSLQERLDNRLQHNKRLEKRLQEQKDHLKRVGDERDKQIRKLEIAEAECKATLASLEKRQAEQQQGGSGGEEL